MVDSSPATVTLPIVAALVNAESHDETNTTVAHVVHDASCGCKAYETSIPSFSKLGFLLMFLLSIYVGTFFMRKETSL